MKKYTAPPPISVDSNKNYKATIILEKGDEIVLELYVKEAPITVNSFIFLSRENYFDNTTFHRVIPGFMVQGGDPTGTGMGGPGYTFENEFHPNRNHDSAGILSMANAGTQNGQATNGSQFFITHGPTPHLDGMHTVFGKVIEGMDVVNNISERDPGTAREPGDLIKTICIEEN